MKVYLDIELTATIPMEVTEEQFAAIEEEGTLDVDELEEIGVELDGLDIWDHSTYVVCTNIEALPDDEEK